MADEQAVEIDNLEKSLEQGGGAPAAPKPSAAVSTTPLKAIIGVLGVICIVLLATTVHFAEEVDTKTEQVTALNALATKKGPAVENVCHKKKPKAGTLVGTSGSYDFNFTNINCLKDNIIKSTEAGQSGVNVTKGYQGDLSVSAVPIMTPYWQANPPLCPVNVHWHLGAEHFSAGEYDVEVVDGHRRLAAGKQVREGYNCGKEDGSAKFTKEYDWKHCVGMHVGETYEVHWPHSAAGKCNTIHQYQTPFYDGVFCNYAAVELVLKGDVPTQKAIGVQAQVFQIVNDESYYYPNLMRGMIVDGVDKGADMAIYTGSTTGTSRSNTVCSRYAPITWQVDRKCHLISASTFDKMCADMKAQNDDMSDDLHAHGARELVKSEFASNNHATGKNQIKGIGERRH